MKILHVTAELAPYSKVGGLGEVAAGLPRALAARGHEVRILTPCYAAMAQRVRTRPLARVEHRFAGRAMPFSLVEPVDAGPNPAIAFLRAPELFEVEPDIYGRARGPSGLGHLRWLWFSAAIRAAVGALEFMPDVVHVHDWHSALVPALWRTDHAFDDDAARAAFVLTVHNAAFQGTLSVDDYRQSELRRDLLSDWYLLKGADVALLKAGLVFADRVTTVSPTYAREVETSTGGAGLEYVFESRHDDLTGVLNGLDVDVWDPATDPALAERFDGHDRTGKRACRRAIEAELGLPAGDGPLVALVGRLTEQKGVDLALDALPHLIERHPGLRFAALGTGDRTLEARLAAAAAHDRVAAVLAYDEALAHRLIAGADVVLMPSRFEPCGLVQLAAQRYGTIPVVRATGGLADTVWPWGVAPKGKATGFAFTKATPEALGVAVDEALAVFAKPRSWDRLVTRVMAIDSGWRTGAAAYEAEYERAIAMRSEGARAEVLDHVRLEPELPELPEHLEIPTHYERDVLRLLLKDPHTIWAYWEVQGEHGHAVLDALDEDERYGSKWQLRMKETASGANWDLDVEAWGKNWYVTVEPERTYSAELWMSPAGGSPVRMARSNEVRTPPVRAS